MPNQRWLPMKIVRNTNTVFYRALRDAVRWGLVVRSAADLVATPRVKQTDAKFWTPDQLRTFLATVKEDRLHAAWVLFTKTVMRRSEVAGLLWAGVDLEGPRLRVRTPRVPVDRGVVVSEPKTARVAGRYRTTGLTADALSQWKDRQAKEWAFVGGSHCGSKGRRCRSLLTPS